MKMQKVFFAGLFLCFLLPCGAASQVVIDGAGLDANGASVSTDGRLMLDDAIHNTIPADLWIGQMGGTLRSCGSSGICTDHGGKGHSIRSMAVFNGKLWIGQFDGVLRSCNSLGNCSWHSDQGVAILYMALFHPASLGTAVYTRNGLVGVNNTNPNVELDVVGDIEHTGTITQVSDQRLKENLRPIEGALAKIQAIEGVYFNMIEEPRNRQTGVTAQNVRKVLPEAVKVVDPKNGYLGVSYPSLVPVLIEAVKELKAENEELKAGYSAQIEDLRHMFLEMQKTMGKNSSRDPTLKGSKKSQKVIVNEAVF